MAPNDAALLKLVPADAEVAEQDKPEAEQPQPTQPQPKPYRRYLPAERHSITHKFQIANSEGYLIVGLYPDGTAGEIFIRVAKEGSTMAGVVDGWAKMVSIALQSGTTISELVERFAGTRFDPSGYTTNPAIPEATSIYDYVVRYLASKFVK